MKVKQVKRRSRMVFLLLMFFTFAGAASAVTINVKNHKFDDGPNWASATYWTEPTYNVYFQPSDGSTYDSGGITGRAATLYSTGAAAICQELEDTYCDSYDTYKITFDLGYRNDFTGASYSDIRYLEVSIRNGSSIIASQMLRIGSPPLDDSVHPNVGTVMNKTVVLHVDRTAQPNEPLSLWFTNTHGTSNPSTEKHVIIDNVSVKGYNTVADWQFDVPDFFNDATGNHDLAALPNKPVYYGSPGVGNTGTFLSTQESTNAYGVYTPHSGDFDLSYFTLSAWVKMPSWAMGLGDFGTVASYRKTGSYNSGFSWYNNDDHWQMQLRSSEGCEYFPETPPPVVADDWTHLAFSFCKTADYGDDENIEKVKLHINGNYYDSQDGYHYKPVIPISPFTIGIGRPEAFPNCSLPFSGLIDNFQYFDHWMTNIEIADVFMETEAKNHTPSPNGTTFLVMTYNIRSLKNNLQYVPYSPEAVRDIIEAVNPDVLCLQEATESNVQWLGDQLGYSYRTWTECSYNFGNAILSKTPLLVVNKYTLPNTGDDQVRKMIVAHLIIEGKPYAIACTHFACTCENPDGPGARILQAQSVLNTLAWCKTPLILAGDLNNSRYGTPCDMLKTHFDESFDVATNQVNEGQLHYDHIMVDRNNFTDAVYMATVITEDEIEHADIASDHYPVVVSFMLQ
ncbi:MAG: endonuclease/exonuclease/phosphatase family protein [Sedimentisphaerales bacterium]|nr:endonuclease/exonuclease/phosphatase family protein [Sedimentisphaerales bacterium]